MEDDDRGLPLLAYVLIGILAVIGLFTIAGWVFGAVMLVLRLAVIAVIVLLGIGIVRAIVGGNRRHSSL